MGRVGQRVGLGLTIAWLAWLRHARPRAAAHENVIGFDAKVLEELVGDIYFIRGIRMSPSDMGFPFMCRARASSLLIRRQFRGSIGAQGSAHPELEIRCATQTDM